jgi:hypothetical protein
MLTRGHELYPAGLMPSSGATHQGAPRGRAALAADQIGSFKRVAAAMRKVIQDLPDEQKDALDEAATVLRKTRAARTYLPLTVIDKEDKQNSG